MADVVGGPRQWNPLIYFLPFKVERCKLEKLIQTGKAHHFRVTETFR
jgi:hypothetical protein